MKNLLKWIVIALGACVVLGVLASIASNGNKSTATATPAALAQAVVPTKTSTPATEVTPTNTPKATDIPNPTNTPKPTSTPQPTKTPQPTAIPATSAPAVNAEAAAAFGTWLKGSVCSPDNQPPIPWCAKITRYEVIMDGLMVWANVAPTDKLDLQDMLWRLGLFGGNNLYKKYGISKVTILSAASQDILAPAAGIVAKQNTDYSLPTLTAVPPAPTWTPSLPAAAPILPTWTAAPAAPVAPPARVCCKICSASKACGDTCISKSKTCNVAPGCACDG
jgi:hypothetical protein